MIFLIHFQCGICKLASPNAVCRHKNLVLSCSPELGLLVNGIDVRNCSQFFFSHMTSHWLLPQQFAHLQPIPRTACVTKYSCLADSALKISILLKFPIWAWESAQYQSRNYWSHKIIAHKKNCKEANWNIAFPRLHFWIFHSIFFFS